MLGLHRRFLQSVAREAYIRACIHGNFNDESLQIAHFDVLVRSEASILRLSRGLLWFVCSRSAKDQADVMTVRDEGENGGAYVDSCG